VGRSGGRRVEGGGTRGNTGVTGTSSGSSHWKSGAAVTGGGSNITARVAKNTAERTRVFIGPPVPGEEWSDRQPFYQVRENRLSPAAFGGDVMSVRRSWVAHLMVVLPCQRPHSIPWGPVRRSRTFFSPLRLRKPSWNALSPA